MMYYLLPILLYTIIATFWRLPAVVLFLLAVTSVWAIRTKEEFWLFFIVGVFGAIADMVILGSGAWSYTTAQFNGIPYWLPLCYGLLALVSVKLYQRIQEESANSSNKKR